MHCELVVPGLLSAQTGARFPSLELLLSRGRRREAQSQALERWLHQAFDLGCQPLPAGPLTLIAADADPGAHFWLRADPVHLRLMRDRLIVVPAEAFAISREEADALCAGLNAHFTGAMEIRALDPRRWVARLTGKEPQLDGVPAIEAAGREIALARSSDAQLTEIQMLLHAHPVNAAREGRGEPAVNSLWLWGAGRAPKATSAWGSVLADEPLAGGLARIARARHGPLPAGARQWLAGGSEEGRHLLVLDALRVPLALSQVAEYRESLAVLERDWFAPLLAALRAGRIGMVTVHVPDGGAAGSFEAIRADLRRFWRRPKALERYA